MRIFKNQRLLKSANSYLIGASQPANLSYSNLRQYSTLNRTALNLHPSFSTILKDKTRGGIPYFRAE